MFTEGGVSESGRCGRAAVRSYRSSSCLRQPFGVGLAYAWLHGGTTGLPGTRCAAVVEPTSSQLECPPWGSLASDAGGTYTS